MTPLGHDQGFRVDEIGMCPLSPVPWSRGLDPSLGPVRNGQNHMITRACSSIEEESKGGLQPFEVSSTEFQQDCQG